MWTRLWESARAGSGTGENGAPVRVVKHRITGDHLKRCLSAANSLTCFPILFELHGGSKGIHHDKPLVSKARRCESAWLHLFRKVFYCEVQSPKRNMQHPKQGVPCSKSANEERPFECLDKKNQRRQPPEHSSHGCVVCVENLVYPAEPVKKFPKAAKAAVVGTIPQASTTGFSAGGLHGTSWIPQRGPNPQNSLVLSRE